MAAIRDDFLRRRSRKKVRATISRAASTTPTAMPAFAPVLKVVDAFADVVDEAVEFV